MFKIPVRQKPVQETQLHRYSELEAKFPIFRSSAATQLLLLDSASLKQKPWQNVWLNAWPGSGTWDMGHMAGLGGDSVRSGREDSQTILGFPRLPTMNLIGGSSRIN